MGLNNGFGNNIVICLWVEDVPFSEVGVMESTSLLHIFIKAPQIKNGLQSFLIATSLVLQYLAVV